MIDKLILWWVKFRKKIEKYPVRCDTIEALLRKYSDHRCYIECVDVFYRTCGYNEAKLISKLVPIRFQKYKKEERDCDNFAWEFRFFVKKLFPNIPVGYCHVYTKHRLHAANFIIYKDKNSFVFSYIEPQTGKLSMRDWKPYLMIV